MNETERTMLAVKPASNSESETDSSYEIGTLNTIDYMTLLEELEHR